MAVLEALFGDLPTGCCAAEESASPGNRRCEGGNR